MPNEKGIGKVPKITHLNVKPAEVDLVMTKDREKELVKEMKDRFAEMKKAV